MISSFGDEMLGRLTMPSKPFDGEGYELGVIKITDGIPMFGSVPGLSVDGSITSLTVGSSE